MSQEQSYLQRISFDPKLATDWVWKYITNIRIVLLLLVTILFLGIVSYINLPRRLNPEIKIPIISVITVLPGASPEDIESLVTVPLETSLSGISGIDTINSTSRDNVSAITIQFISSVSQDKAKQDVQSAVDTVTALPTDAQTPMVKAFDFEDQPIWTFTVSGSDTASLMRFSQYLKKQIEQVPKVDRVVISGFENQEIAVTVHPEKVKEYGLNPFTLASTVKAHILSYPAGPVESTTNTFALTIDPQVNSVADLRALRITTQGQTVRLGDIATIAQKSSKDQRASYRATHDSDPKRVVTFSVFKTMGSNIDAAEKATREVVAKATDEYDNAFTITTNINTAEEITKQFVDLVGEFQSTIILVFICLYIFLGLRQAIIASLTVPLTFLSAFIFMQYMGMSINFLSLFAFLLALGLLVDDTIVVVSAMTTYFKIGKFSTAQTGRIVWKDTIVPIWSTTITTIWSFVPLLLSTGIIGEFIKPIPVVVTITMISSTAIAVLITLPFMIVILKPSIAKRVVTLGKLLTLFGSLIVIGLVLKTHPFMIGIVLVYVLILWVLGIIHKTLAQSANDAVSRSPSLHTLKQRFLHTVNHGILDIEVLSQKYFRLITRILASKRARKITIFAIVVYALWAFALLPMGLVKNEFFPKEDNDILYINLELPPGTKSEITSQEALAILSQIKQTPDTQSVSVDIGSAITSRGNVSQDESNAALFTVKLPEKSKRKQNSLAIAEKLRADFASFTKGTISIVEVTGGPPAGADLQIELFGSDLVVLQSYAEKVISYLKQQPGTTNVKKSINPGTSKLVFEPDMDALARYGIGIESLGIWLRTYASTFTLGEVKFDKSDRESQDIVFRFSDAEPSPDEIASISVPTKNNDFVPLLALGKLVPKTSPTAITRENGKRTITVSAGVRPGFVVSDKNKQLETFADTLALPSGYGWKTGGVNEENQKSVQSILQAMVVAFILILVTMVIQFQSYRQALIVLLVIPLAVSSVFAVFALTGTPLSFPALIGVLSLFGIVVTNSMFIVDKINLNLKEHMPFTQAIADAGASRMEPIILTKLCTVLGLLPITLAEPLWRGLGGAIISGLLIASTIMLLFIPVVYFEWFKNDPKYHPENTGEQMMI